MERQLWPQLYQLLLTAGKHHDRRRKQFNDACIAMVYMWAVLHDRPISWACDMRNWRGEKLSPMNLPSPSTMSRRLNGSCLGVQQLLEQAQKITQDWFPKWFCYWIDSKPLTVSGVSKDRDARYGRAAGCKAKGYRLHVLYNAGGAVVTWMLGPMNQNDVPAAHSMLNNLLQQQRCGQQPPLLGYVVGDNQYDANILYDGFAAVGLQLVARPRNNAKQVGHDPQSAHRLAGLDLVKRSFGQNLLQSRGGMERYFANTSSFSGGLGPLPSWVRTPHRVARWVGCKLIIDAVRRAKKQRVAA